MPIEYSTIGGATPNDYYRDLAQSFINQSWTNNAAKTPENGGEIKEQAGIGSDEYKIIDAWVKTTVGDVTIGMRDSGDFIKIYFRDIGHIAARGLYYQFFNSWWICNEFGHFSGIAQDCGLRRCNNVLKIVDPENGSVFSVPCVVDYDMSSPSAQVSSYIITPNNHATVMVQGNSDTLRLFKLNTRYIFGGRPFKLLAYQNALIDDSIATTPTLLYLDLYLDEIHAEDDIVNQLADNGSYQYSVEIDSADMKLTNGATGSLTASVSLNGEEVNREIVWSSSDLNIVTIDEQGNYQIAGTDGQSCTITATLQGNTSVTASIQIVVVNTESLQAKIMLDPVFNKIRQYETIDFVIKASYGSQLYEPTNTTISLSQDGIVLSNQYLSIQGSQGSYQITGLQIVPVPQLIYVSVQNETPEFTATSQFQIEVTSMMG